MNTRSHPGRHGKRFTTAAIAAAASLAVAGLAPAGADAGVVMDLRVTTINGVPVTNSKYLFGQQPGDVVTLDLFAVLSGTNGLNDESIQSVSGSIISGSGAPGNLFGGVVAPFNAPGSQDGSHQDLDGDGDLDIGSQPNGGVGTEYFLARASSQTPGTPLDANTSEVRVGRFNFTFNNSVPQLGAFINFVPRADATGAPVTAGGVWVEDGVGRSPTLGSLTAGAPVLIAPEPAATAATALAGLALLARRRQPG